MTVDFDTLTDGTVTIRERDSMLQVRLPKADVANIIYDIVHGRTDWEQVMKKHPVVQVDDGEGGAPTSASDLQGEKNVVVVSNSRGRFSRPAESLVK